jgi:hypothetical protein
MKIFNFNKTITVYVGVNKNGSIALHSIEPIRDEARGMWISRMPFCNSIAYNQLVSLVEKSNLNWNNDPEPITLNI